MSTIINGTSNAITFPDSSVQNTSAIVSGYVPYANLPAGSVLQVVAGSYTTTASTTSTSFVDTGLSLAITPKFATSKVLILVTQCGLEKSSGSTQNCIDIGLFRSATQLASSGFYGIYTNSTLPLTIPSATLFYLDSPATTSSTTYKTQFRNPLAASTVYVQSGGSPASTIVLLEIAA
jgi:hypothetical protein